MVYISKICYLLFVCLEFGGELFEVSFVVLRLMGSDLTQNNIFIFKSINEIPLYN